MRVECPGTVETGMQGQPLCVDQPGGIALMWQEQQPYQIDVDAAFEPFSAGFLLVASCWALGKGVAVVIGLVKK